MCAHDQPCPGCRLHGLRCQLVAHTLPTPRLQSMVRSRLLLLEDKKANEEEKGSSKLLQQ